VSRQDKTKYQEEPSCLVLPTCLRKNINQFKVKLKSIYQNLVEATFDTYFGQLTCAFFYLFIYFTFVSHHIVIVTHCNMQLNKL
jgi:hypothetical protein